MKCKECNERRRKKTNESRKKAIVRSYVRDWTRWLRVLLISVLWYALYVLLINGDGLDYIFRLGLAITLLVLFFSMLVVIGRMKPGLLSMSALMLWVGPVTMFKTPVVDLIFLFLVLSQAALLLDVGAGVIFKIKVTPVERPWCPNKDIRDIKSKGKKQ